MTKRQKIKSWFKKHPDAIIITTSTVAGLGTLGTIVVMTVKQQKNAVEKSNISIAAFKAWIEAMNKWIDDERIKGNDIYQLDDGQYLVIPTDTQRELVVK